MGGLKSGKDNLSLTALSSVRLLCKSDGLRIYGTKVPIVEVTAVTVSVDDTVK